MKLAVNRMRKSHRPRTLVIGDIHGSAKALEQVLDRAYVTEDDTIIQIGDVADGWSETAECVEILIQHKRVGKCIFIRGNHDVWVYDWFKYGHSPIIWTQQGGKATIDSYVRTGLLMTNDHKKFWNEQIDCYIDDENRLFIHGGWDYTAYLAELHSGRTMRDIFYKQAYSPVNVGSIAKECHWDRSVLDGAKSGSVKNKETGEPTGFKALEQFNEVYIGHTAIRAKWHGTVPQPENYLNLYNVDTGCGWHGVLTIMDVDTKEYWQSDTSRSLYPDEMGR